MTVKPIPDGYATLTPYLIIKGAAKAMDFYKQALGASEIFRLTGDDGRVGHAEMQIGSSKFMLADEFPEMGMLAPEPSGKTPVSFLVYVEDVDKAFAKALAEGGTLERPLANQFYGDRSGTFLDPFNHRWNLATHIEDVSPEEIDRRCQQMSPEKK
ncbi:MAG: VOC family protein [Gemmataceae bacterium]|nr:VOC family protein [Gemmataceae bacterium]